jgi:hypothetical protein
MHSELHPAECACAAGVRPATGSIVVASGALFHLANATALAAVLTAAAMGAGCTHGVSSADASVSQKSSTIAWGLSAEATSCNLILHEARAGVVQDVRYSPGLRGTFVRRAIDEVAIAIVRRSDGATAASSGNDGGNDGGNGGGEVLLQLLVDEQLADTSGRGAAVSVARVACTDAGGGAIAEPSRDLVVTGS